MVKPVDRNLSDKGISSEQEVLAYLSEVDPVLRRIRSTVNAIAGSGQQYQLTIGTTGSGADYECDGTADDVQFQEALDAAAASDNIRRIFVLPGTYYMSAQINMTTGIALHGSGPGRTKIVVAEDFPDDTADAVFGAKPPTGGLASVKLGRSIIRNFASYVVLDRSTDMSQFTIDDYVILSDEGQWNTSDSSITRGELLKINAIGADVYGSDGSIVIDARTNEAVLTTVTSQFTSGMEGLAIAIERSLTGDNNGVFEILDVTDSKTCRFKNVRIDAADDTTGTVSYFGPCLAAYGIVRDTYERSKNAKVSLVPWVDDIEICGFEFTQAAEIGTRTESVLAAPMIGLRFCKNVRVADIYVHDAECPGIVLQTCVQVKIHLVQIRDLADSDETGDVGDGIIVGGLSDDVIITGLSADRCRTGVNCRMYRAITEASDGTSLPTDTGVCRGLVVNGCYASRTTDSGFTIGAAADGAEIVGCKASGTGGYGFRIHGTGTVVHSCTVENSSGGIIVGHEDEDNPVFYGSGSSVSNCVIRHLPWGKILGSLEYRTRNSWMGGNGEGIVLCNTDHVTVHSNQIEIVTYSIVLRNKVTNAKVVQNLIYDGGYPDWILLSATGTNNVAIESASGSTCDVVEMTKQPFYAGLVGMKIVLSGFTNPANNITATVAAYVDESRITVSFPSGTPVNEAAGAGKRWSCEHPRYNEIADNTVAVRAMHPSGYHQRYERDVVGYPRDGIQVTSADATGNIIVRNKVYGLGTSVLNDVGTSTVKQMNIGTPESLGIPVFSPSAGTAVQDSNYLLTTTSKTTGATEIDITEVDQELGLAKLFKNAGAPFFVETDVGRTVTTSNFANTTNNSIFAIYEFIDAFTVKIYAPYTVVETSGQATIARAGVQDGAMSYHSNDNAVYIRSGSSTHTKIGSESTPVGEVTMWAGSSAAIPTKWLHCNGQAVSRTTYAALFTAIGTTFGAGDGSTTFNVPDFRNRSPMGADTTVANGATSGALTVTHNHAATGLSDSGHTHGPGSLTVADHTHGLGSVSVASHTHNLGDAGWAQIAFNTSHDIYMRRLSSITSYTSNFAESLGGTTRSNTSLTTAAALDGATDGATATLTGTLGGTAPAVTGGATATGNAVITGNVANASPSVLHPVLGIHTIIYSGV